MTSSDPGKGVERYRGTCIVPSSRLEGSGGVGGATREGENSLNLTRQEGMEKYVPVDVLIIVVVDFVNNVLWPTRSSAP